VRVAVIGAGAVGHRVAETLAADGSIESVTVIPGRPGESQPGAGRHWEALRTLAAAAASRIQLRSSHGIGPLDVDVTVLTSPANTDASARLALRAGSHVVCPVDDPAEVRSLLALDREARALGLSLAVGTAMAPGLSCVLAAHLRTEFDRVEEIHVASLGTGGPACARRHHAALTGVSVDWEDGAWRRRPGGSGRELVWFPEPVGGADCYRAALAGPLLLAPAFPHCRRITARMEATRRDRLTSWLPMMRPPHPEGLVGAVRVEMRGWVGSVAETKIIGAARPPAEAAAAVCSVAARWAGAGQLARTGAGGLAELVDEPAAFLRELGHAGVAVAVFERSDV
jgi:saccharopine dehydrogenase-like NADP-dependent oxidoreductase